MISAYAMINSCNGAGDPISEAPVAQENKRGNREAKKPKQAKPKTIAAAPSTKGNPVAAAAAKPKK